MGRLLQGLQRGCHRTCVGGISHHPDAAPEFNGPGCTGASAACDGMASSSSSSTSVHVVKPQVDDYYDAGSIASTPVAAADAPAGEKVDAHPTAIGIKRKLPSTSGAGDNTGLRPLPAVTRRLRPQANGHLQVLVRIGRSKLRSI